MKHLYTLPLIALLLVACSSEKKNSVEKVIESNNLELIRKKRGEMVNELQTINDQIKSLDDKIKVLDSAKHIPLITTFKAEQKFLIIF